MFVDGADYEDAYDKLKRRYAIFGIMVNEMSKEVVTVKKFHRHVMTDPIYGHRIRVVTDRLFYSAYETIRNRRWDMYISPKSGWHTSLEMFWSRGAMNMDWEFDCWKEKQDEFYRDFRCEWYLSWEVNKNGSRLADILIESWLMDHPDYRMAAKNAA